MEKQMIGNTDNPEKRIEGRVSIIIPCYNSEATLERTLKSATNQKYTDLEIIAVDDGSHDRTADILTEYSKKDSRIRTISIPNSGPSAARMKGLDVSTGEYIQFLDSDDILLPDAIENLMQTARRDGSDMVELSFLIETQNGERIKSVETITGTMSGTEALKLNMNGGYWALWSRFTKAELFDKVTEKAEGMIFGEDLIMSVQLLMNAKRISVCGKRALVYFIREGSLSTGPFSERRRHDTERYMKWVFDYLTELGCFPEFNKAWWGFRKFSLLLKVSERWTNGISIDFKEIGEALERYPELRAGLSPKMLKLFKSYRRNRLLGNIRLKKYIRKSQV